MTEKTEDQKKEDEDERRSRSGIYVTKGMTLTIPRGGLRLSLTGGSLDNSVEWYVLLDVCPVWLEIAYQHVLVAERSNHEALNAQRKADNEELANALEVEFAAGMQAIMAGAIAVDAFYANIKGLIVVPEDLTRTWRENKTARYKQIAEVMRRAFQISPDNAKQLRDVLKEIFRFRDLSVHPSGQAGRPTWHPELEVNTEWRFVAFCFLNAQQLVGSALSLIAQATIKPQDKSPELKRYCQGASARVVPLLSQWEARYGELFERNTSENSSS